MSASLRAGFHYGAAAFGVGALLGPVRALVLEPLVSPLPAAVIGAAPLLAALVLLAPWIARAQGVGPGAAERMAMGLWAAGLVLALDLVLSLALGRFEGWVAAFATPAGLVGLALVVALALMPLLHR